MSNKSTAKQIETYLVEKGAGYLFSDISVGKLVMIAGKWGSGKTYFWHERLKKELKCYSDDDRPIVTISLYGKESIDEIKKELYFKIYEYNKGEDFIEKTFSIFTTYFESPSVFGLKLDKNEIISKNIEKKFKVAQERLDNQAVICFDDFERKSSKIDLSDLFGFITHLKETYNCTVVVIVNDEAFEGENNKVFARVKEKSVDKFLRYIPYIEQLYDDIVKAEMGDVQDEALNSFLNRAKTLLVEIDFQNARVYKQIIDNIVEVYNSQLDYISNILTYLVLNTIFFNKHHKCLELEEDFPVDYRHIRNSDESGILCEHFSRINIFKEMFPQLYDTDLESKERCCRNIFKYFIEFEGELNRQTVHFKYESLDHLKSILPEIKESDVCMNTELLKEKAEVLYDAFDFVVNRRLFRGLTGDFFSLGLPKKICEFVKTGMLL